MVSETDMSEVTLAVLAGGRGSRMGKPKGGLQLHGRSILRHILAESSWMGPTLLVTAPGQEHPRDWERFGREVSDPVAGEGPLRGILTAIQQACTPVVLVLPVDMPSFGNGCLCYLADQLIARPAIDAVMLRTDRCGKSLIEPLPIALRRRAETTIQNQLASQHRSVHGLQNQPHVTVVDAPSDWPPNIWTNLNDHAELNDYLTGQNA